MKERNLDHPSFLGIGAARSGTTWIGAQLKKSPSIWMPRRKELHYFTRSLKYPSSSHLADSSLLKRLFSLAKHNVRFKQELVKALGRDTLHLDFPQLLWDFKYFLGNYNDDWYLSLFEHKSDFVTGEITPAYSLLDDDDLVLLSSLLPNIKLIFIMRNPVERAWSTIRYHEKRYKNKLTQLPHNEIIDYLNNNAITSRSDYLEILDRWEKYFSKEQMLIAFYDEITDSPRELLDRICNFLSIDAIPLTEKEAARRINVSIDSTMPQIVRKSISESCRDQISALAGRYGSYASKWLDEIDAT